MRSKRSVVGHEPLPGRRRAAARAASRAAPRGRRGCPRAAAGTSASVSGPTYAPSTEAIGAMSQAPRHSNERTLNSGSSPAAARIASYSSSAPHSEQEMFVHTYTRVAPDGGGLEHVVEGRDGDQLGGGQPHHARDLVDRLGRAPAVHPLRGLQRRQDRGAGVGVERHVRLDLRAQPLGHLRGSGTPAHSGISAGSLSRSAAMSQPGTREPWA